MLPNSVKREGAYLEGGNDTAGDQSFGDSVGWRAAHMLEPIEHRGRDVDRRGSLEGRPVGDEERGQGVKVDQGREDGLDQVRSPPAPFVPPFSKDHSKECRIRKACEFGTSDGCRVCCDRAKEA